MERNTKKRILTGIFALSCACVLASCDPAESLPLNYDSPIVYKDGAEVDLYNNKMGVIYDAINSGKNDKVLEQLLFKIGVDQFGDWKQIVELASDPVAHRSEILTFVESHKNAYKNSEKDEKLVKPGFTLEDIYIQRFVNFYNDMKDRISEVFYNEITSKSYNDEDGAYHEMRLAVAHYGEMYDIKELDVHEDESVHGWYVKYLTPDLKKDSVEEYVHLDRYADYIERKIIPQIYKDKMVEEYLIKNNWATLGRAYGRKVSMIKISHDSKNIDIADKMFKDFADKEIVPSANDVDFEILANAWKGLDGLTADGKVVALGTVKAGAIQLMDARPELHELVDISAHLDEDVKNNPVGVASYYKGTELGEIMDDYIKACRAEGDRFAAEEDKTALSSFTNSGAQSKEKGLKSKVAELALKDYTTDDWFVKNSGIGELPSELSSRLFNINVSNGLDALDPEGRSKNYLRVINDHAFLTPARSQKESADPRNYVIHDKGSNAFYIVQVLEAPSSSKLNIDGDASYLEMKDNPLFTEMVGREIAQILGTKDSYVTDAQADYLKLYAIEYHDKSVYDYFKSKYPDLFE